MVMNSGRSHVDIWALPLAPVNEEQRSALVIQTIRGIEPLGRQFGVSPKKTVPTALLSQIFGQLATSSDHSITADGLANPPLPETYAILDAAKIQGLPEMLEASGLQYRCLFKGKAYQDLGEVAPWIVRLDEGNGFTRQLFTKGDASWQMWDKEPAIFLRSYASFDEVYGHFRKFGRVQNGEGKWFYLNIADGRLFRELAHNFKDREQSILRPMLSAPSVLRLICINAIEGSAFIMALEMSPGSSRHSAENGNYLTDKDIAILSRLKHIRLAEVVTCDMIKAFPKFFKDAEIGALRSKAFRTVEHMLGFGFDQTYQIRHLAAWGLFYGENFEQRDPTGELDRICRSVGPPSERFSHFALRMHKIEAKEWL